MKIEVRELIPEEIDIDEFIARMPPYLRNDLERGWGEPRAALRAQIACPSEDRKAIFLDGVPVVLFGAVPPPGGAGFWVLQSGGFEKIRVALARAIARYGNEWGEKYGSLRGFVHSEFTEMINFLCRQGGVVRDLGSEYGNYTEVSKSWA
jgi:hypothetical protein